MDTLLSIGIGLGLSAACGFRVFVPLLVASVAAQAGHLSLAPGFEWVGTQPALYAFATATLLEILAYYIPWLDNVLDAIATPAAVMAGMLAGAAVFTDLPPLLKWSLAIIAGGAAAGMVQGATSLLRLQSTALSGGLANPVLSTLELAGSFVMSVVALMVPVVALLLVVALCVGAFRLAGRVFFGRHGTRRPSRSDTSSPA
jgi:Domain of unknown function (DUF4126)